MSSIEHRAASARRSKTICDNVGVPSCCANWPIAARCAGGARSPRCGRRCFRWWNLRPPGDPYGAILLNSNARSHFGLTNAIGPSQLKALRLIRQNTRHPWLILLHHQVVECPSVSVSLRERIGLALINAPDLVALLAPHARRVVVLHGHRHRDWVGVCGNIVLCSAPSTSLGADGVDKYHGSFHIHQLLPEAGGGIRLIATERVRVS
jgi:hypothetical protein